MQSWRKKGFALWALAALAATGCSTTSIPARAARLATGQVYEDASIPSSRLVAIGKTFEGQGNYTKARRMYSLVLNREPGNRYAVASLQQIRHMQDGQVPPRSMSIPQAAPMFQQPTMIAYSGSVTPPRPKTALVAASTVPVRSAYRASVDTDVVNIAPPAPKISESDWKLPVVISSPSVVTGAVRVAGLGPEPAVADEFVMPVAGTADSAPGTQATFEKMLEDPAQHVPALLSDLDAADTEVRANAAFLLGEAGSQAAGGAVAELRKRLASEGSESVRITFAEALGKLEASNEASRSTLLAGLHSPVVEVRAAAAFALRVFGPQQDAVALDVLRDTLMDKDDSVAAMAALSLSDFGTAAQVAIPDLEIIRNDASARLRDAIDSALNRIRK